MRVRHQFVVTTPATAPAAHLSAAKIKLTVKRTNLCPKKYRPALSAHAVTITAIRRGRLAPRITRGRLADGCRPSAGTGQNQHQAGEYRRLDGRESPGSTHVDNSLLRPK